MPGPLDRLVDALIKDDARLAFMYQQDAEFHAAVQTVARFLPVVVNVIADECARAAAARQDAAVLAICAGDLRSLVWRPEPDHDGAPGYGADLPGGNGHYWLPTALFDSSGLRETTTDG